ncbi:MAG: hypothetical protein R3B07_03315 [Polyangiaceae bacterium]
MQQSRAASAENQSTVATSVRSPSFGGEGQRSTLSKRVRRLGAGALLGSFVALGVTACGGAQNGQQGNLADSTTIGKNRCADAATNQLRPFIVEWDATDLASFESKAARDIVFVKYEGCQLTVLEGCSDAGVPGKYGRYNPPQFTSGTLEGFEINNEDELYAKLPLGVATFGGRLSMGESLKLNYYVTGTASASRESISRAEIESNPKCAQATHFVSKFNLGAFELDSRKSTEASADVGVGDIGGGGEHKHDEKNLKRGGDMEDCKTQAQRACRVPIRVVLQELGAGAEAGDAKLGVAAPPAPPPVDQTPEGQARTLRFEANKKRDNGDGAGCLADLERADKLDPHAADRGAEYTKAVCEMLAGMCESGKKHMREFLAAQDTGRKKTDKELDQQVSGSANTYCPASRGGTPQEQITRAMSAIAQAQQRGETARCIEEAEAIEKLIPTLPMPKHLPPRASANGVLSQAAMCLQAAGKCDDAKKWYAKYYEAQFKGTMPDAEYSKISKQQVEMFAQRCTP